MVTHQAPATFSSRVNLVSVPVVVRDKDGHAVGGLKQDDFRLFDKGKPQVITKFTIQTGTSAVTTAAPAEAKPSAAPLGQRAAEAATLPDRYVAYYFDDIHMQPGELLEARRAASHHLDTALDPSTRAGIFTTSGRTTQGFTNDRAKLHDALARIRPWQSAIDKQECLRISFYVADMVINQEHSVEPTRIEPSSRLAAALYTEGGACLNPLEPPPPPQVIRYVWSTAQHSLQVGLEETGSGLSVLRDLIGHMSVLPGSRTVVMVSPGFILSAEQRTPENDILEGAIRAKVVVNALDIKGVYTPLQTRELDAEFGGNFGGSLAGPLGAARTAAERDEVARATDLLSELADGTGGTVHNDNDFEGGLTQLAARPEFVYVLGFSPDSLKFDGSYHGLKVRLKESAKYEIEARRGYWAPAHAMDASESAREELKETFFSRDEISDIPLELHAEFFRPADAKPQVSVVARLDTKALRFQKTGERNNDNVTVVTGLFDQNGNYVSGIERKLELRLRDHSLQVLDDAGISVEESFSVSPGNYIVRVVVKDSEGHLTAARNAGIQIP